MIKLQRLNEALQSYQIPPLPGRPQAPTIGWVSDSSNVTHAPRYRNFSVDRTFLHQLYP